MRTAIIVFLIPAIIAVFAMIGISSDKKAEVVHVAAAYGPGTGYELVPEQYNVTASPSFKWSHGTRSVGLIVVGFIFFAGAAGYVYWVNSKVKVGSALVLLLICTLGYVCIIGKHTFRYYDLKKYERSLSAEEYEKNKGNLDAIFLP